MRTSPLAATSEWFALAEEPAWEAPRRHLLCVNLASAGGDLLNLGSTTATSELSEEQLGAYPLSGRMFTLRVDVPGQPVPA